MNGYDLCTNMETGRVRTCCCKADLEFWTVEEYAVISDPGPTLSSGSLWRWSAGFGLVAVQLLTPDSSPWMDGLCRGRWGLFIP